MTRSMRPNSPPRRPPWRFTKSKCDLMAKVNWATCRCASSTRVVTSASNARGRSPTPRSLAGFARATPSLQLAGSAAFLAEKLRGGVLAGQIRLEEFAPVVEGLAGYYPQAARVQEFITMFRQARRLTGE